MIARLADGVALPQARAAAGILYQELQQAPPSYSGVSRNARLELVSAERGYSPQRASLTQALSILACTVTLALLVICGNVANLLLVRTATRDRELAVRLSLGATRWRLIRQLMTENLLLTALGAGAGLLLAAWGTDLLAGLVRSAPVATIADGTPALELDAALDLRVIAFTVLRRCGDRSHVRTPARAAGIRHADAIGAEPPQSGRPAAVSPRPALAQSCWSARSPLRPSCSSGPASSSEASTPCGRSTSASIASSCC